jgi:hypothetical protein
VLPWIAGFDEVVRFGNVNGWMRVEDAAVHYAVVGDGAVRVGAIFELDDASGCTRGGPYTALQPLSMQWMVFRSVVRSIL